MKKREGLKIFSYGVLLLLILGSIIAFCYFMQNKNQVLNPSEASGESFESGELNKGDEERVENVTPITSSKKKENGDVEVKLNNVKEGEIIITTTKEKPSANDERWEEVENIEEEYIIPANEVDSEEIYVWYKNGNNVSLMSNSEIGTIAAEGAENFKLSNYEKTITVTKVEPTLSVTIKGDGFVGKELRAQVATNNSEGNITYQWYYVEGTENKDIDGATAETYTPTLNESGKEVGVKVTIAETTNYTSVSKNSANVTIVVANYKDNADPVNYYTTLEEAFKKAETESTITVLQDVTDNSYATLETGKTYTLNLEDKTITKTKYGIHNNGTFTIEGTGIITTGINSGEGLDDLILTTSGTLNIEEGVTLEHKGVSNQRWAHALVFKGENIEADLAGNIRVSLPEGQQLDDDCDLKAIGIEDVTGGNINITGGEIVNAITKEQLNEQTPVAIVIAAKNNSVSGILKMTGGKVKNETGAGIQMYKDGEVVHNTSTFDIEVDGGEFDCGVVAIMNQSLDKSEIIIKNGTLSGGTAAICSYKDANIKIEEGTITGGTYAILTRGPGSVTVNGGTLTGTTKEGIGVFSSTNVTVTSGNIKGKNFGICLESTATGSLTITGGQVIGESNSGVIVNGQTNSVIIGTHGEGVNIKDPMIQGGTYGLEVANGFDFYDGILKGKTDAYHSKVNKVEEGYGPTHEIDGEYKVSYLVLANYTDETYYYKTLNNAFKNAENGSTIKPLKETIEETDAATVAEDKTYILDLNGKTITSNIEEQNFVENLGTLKITNETGTGKITMTIGKNVIQNNGILTIESGTIENNTTGNAVIQTGSASNTTISGGTITGATGIELIGGNVSINNGTVKGTSYGIEVSNDAGSLTITGGQIIGETNSGVIVNGQSNVVIGTHGEPVSIATPMIQGGTYGLQSVSGFNFYDGILKGKTDAYSVEGTVTPEESYGVYHGTEEEYKVAYLKALIEVPKPINVTYDGNSHKGVADGIGYTLTGSVDAIDAGIYDVTVELSEGYMWSDGTSEEKQIQWTINQKEIEVEWDSLKTWVYDTYSHIPTATVDTGVTNEVANLSITEPKTDVGEYTATATISEITGGQGNPNNYKLTGNTTTFTITIATPDLEVTITGIKKINQILTAQVETNSLGAKTYQWFYVEGTETKNIADATLNTYTPTVDMAGKNVGVTVTVEATNNYTSKIASAQVRIEMANYTDGTNYYETLNDAFANATSGKEIKVLADTVSETTKATLAVDRDYTLNLNGKTITSNVAEQNFVENLGTLKIINETGTGKITMTAGNNVIQNNGTLTIESGTIENNTTGNAVIQTGNTSNTTISGGTIIGATGIELIGGNVSINNGTVTGNKTAGISNKGEGTVTVIEGTVSGASYGIYQTSNGVITVTGGSITGTNAEGIKNTGTGEVIIGEKGELVNIEKPMIQGGTYGLEVTNGFEFYDGILKGKKEAFTGSVKEKETGYGVYKGSEGEYQVAYLKLIVKVPIPENKIYNGKEQIGVQVATGYTLSADVSAIDAGEYNVTATLSNGYVWEDETSGTKTIKWKIEPKTIKVNWDTQITWVYDTKEHIPEATVNTEVEGENAILSIMTPQTDVGEYTATATISEITGGRQKPSNYSLIGNTQQFTITIATSNITVTITGTKQVNKPLKAQVETNSTGAKVYQWYYVDGTENKNIDGAITETYTPTLNESGKKVGVKVEIAETNNYTAVSGSAEVTIVVANYQDDADPINYYTTLKEAFENAPTESTIKPLKEIIEETETATVAEGRTYILDLNGKTITANVAEQNFVENLGTLKINDKTDTGKIIMTTGNNVIQNNGTLTIESGTIENNTTGNAVIQTGSASNTTISGGTIIGVTGIKVENSSTNVTVKNGNINGKECGIVLTDTATGSLNITGGQVVGENSDGVLVQGQSNVVIGTVGGEVSITNPMLQGGTYGLEVANGFEFYDGILKGKTNAYSVEGTITPEKGYGLTHDIDGDYKTSYLIYGNYTDGIYVYDTLRNAFRKAANGSTIKAITEVITETNLETEVVDISEDKSAVVGEGKSFILNLNGKTIHVDGALGSSFITNKGTLKITSSEDGGKIEMNCINANVDTGGESNASGEQVNITMANMIQNEGFLTIDSGTLNLSVKNVCVSSVINQKVGLTTVNNGKINCLGEYDFKTENDAKYFEEYASSIGIALDSGKAIINGGTIKANSVISSYGIANNGTESSVEIEMNGGTIESSYNGISFGIKLKANENSDIVSSLKISDNSIIHGKYNAISNNYANVNIEINDNASIAGDVNGIYFYGNGNVVINGGKITGSLTGVYAYIDNGKFVLGTEDGDVHKDKPVVQGGLNITNGFEFYDGILINSDEPYTGDINKKETDYGVKFDTQIIDNEKYQVAYLTKEITSADLLETNIRYDGTEKTPEVVVKWREDILKVNRDYTVQYSNNINVGTATVVIIGSGDYVGTLKLSFEISNGLITGRVTITGNAVVGENLTVDVSKIIPEGCQLTYKWYYSDTDTTENGILIDNAISDNIIVPEVATGKYIYVVVTANKDYYDIAEFKDIIDIENNKTAVVVMSRLMERMITENTPYVIGMERTNGKLYEASLISKIIIETNKKVPENVITSWDVSMNNGDKAVMAWLIADDTSSNMYELHIGGVGEKIYAPINAKDLFAYYENCASIEGLEYIDTGSTTSMRALFKKDSAISELDLSEFKTTNVTDMGSMFEGCTALSTLNIENLDTLNVTAMDFMFADCSNIEILTVDNFKTGNVETMEAMFANCKILKSINVSKFATSKVKNIAKMFMECNVLTNIDVEGFDTTNVTNMDSTFYNCKALTELNVERFNTSNVENMHATFYGLENVESLAVYGFDTREVKDMSFMFAGCKNVNNLNVSNFSTVNKVLINIEGMFKDVEKVTEINLNNLDTSSVTEMNDLFNGCKALTNVSIEKFNTENVLDMSNMFANCTSLPEIDVISFNTSNVVNMSSMFENCSNLKILDLETFNTGHINDIRNMFKGDSKLTSINLGPNFGRINGTDMFKDCDNLEFIIARNIGSMTLSTDTGLRSGEVEIYVSGKNAEENYERAENYNTVFGEEKIRSIIELIGDDFIEINKGDKYVDEGALVVGKNEDEGKTRYLQYMYTYAVKGLGFSTNEVGEHLITYTLTDKFGQEVLSITRTVKISNLLVVDTTEFSTSNAKWSGWKLFGNANIDNNGNLNLYSDGDFAEKWFIVGGTKWSMYITSLSINDNVNKNFNIITEYYDKDFNPVAANNGKTTDTKTITNSYSTATSVSWNSDLEYGLNVEYVKVKIVWDKSVSGSEIQVKGLYFGSGMNDTYSGMKISAYSDDSELNEIKYLWTTKSTDITKEQVTNVAKNNEIVYPKYGVKGTYYLWTYVTNTKGLASLTCSEPILIDNIEIEVDVPNIAFGKTSKVNAYVFDKYSQYVDDWRDYEKYTKNGTVTNESIKANAESAYFGSKAWNLNKSGRQEELHSNESIFNRLDEGSYLLVSANYRTENSAGRMVFDIPKIYDSTLTKEYNSEIVAEYMDIYEDNNEHHIYYLIKLNENVSTDIVVSGCLPAWGYSIEAGNMIIDGVQWFTFSDINNLDDGIAVKKYAEGEKDISYFRENGNVFTDNNFYANTNGIYTVYGRTNNGVERVRIIVVGSVDTTTPNISVDLSGYIENAITSDDVSVVVTGTDDSAGVAKIEYSFDQTEWTDIIPDSNNNVLLNSDFDTVEEVNYGWDTTENGNLMALHWKGFNPNVQSPEKGYHAHIDREIFKSNVFSIINRNSEFGMEGREIAAETTIPKNTLKAGTSYILSFDMYAENVEVSVNNGLEYYSKGSNALNFYSTTVGMKAVDDEVGHWVRKSFTFTTPSDMDINKESVLHIFGHLQAGSLEELGGEGTFYIKNVKLEEGSQMTDWTPSVIEQTQKTKKGFVKFTSDMDKEVYFKVTDAAGNETVTSKHIIIDKTIPEITSVSINNNADTTKNVEVIVRINKGSDDIKYMYIGNEDKKPSYNDWVDFKGYSKHYLIPGNGETKTVYVWVKDKAGNISEVKTDDIKLEASYTLKVTNNQTYSGTAPYTVYYAIRTESGTYSNWQTEIDFKNLIPNTVYYVKTKIQDVNGLVNESEELKYRAVYDTLNKLILEVMD